MVSLRSLSAIAAITFDGHVRWVLSSEVRDATRAASRSVPPRFVARAGPPRRVPVLRSGRSTIVKMDAREKTTAASGRARPRPTAIAATHFLARHRLPSDATATVRWRRRRDTVPVRARRRRCPSSPAPRLRRRRRPELSRSNFTFVNDGEMFYNQHHVTYLDNGNILLIDNGNMRPTDGSWSRAAECVLRRQRARCCVCFPAFHFRRI